MNNQGREYRYQKDWTLGKVMYHVRCDDWKDFVEATRNIEVLIKEEVGDKIVEEVSTGKMIAGSLKNPADMACNECGMGVGPERQITWNGKQFWVRDCESGQKHKTGFFRKAS